VTAHPWFGAGPFLTASAFSTMAFLDRWARGLGGPWHHQVERYFERRRKQGVRALRVFDETTGWYLREREPHPFFNIERATSELMWDYGLIARPGPDVRPSRLTAHHQVMLLELIRLARKHDMKIELVVDATLKHTPGVSWNVIGHCIRCVADYLRNVHRGEWVDGADPSVEFGMGSALDPVAHARIRQAFENVKGPLAHLVAVETHNEADAHSLGSWKDSELDEAGAIRELNLQLQRFRRGEQWPEGAVWVSQGGNDGDGEDGIQYDPELPDCIAIHPERPSLAWRGRFDSLKRHGKPIYLNEIRHHVGDEYAWTIGSWFSPTSSTTEHEDYYDFVVGNIAEGRWVCDHSLVGMSTGYFLQDGEWHEMPLDPFEKMLLADGEPEPPRLVQVTYAHVIAYAYRELLKRDPDREGLEHYDAMMRNGMTESELREQLIRSEEFAQKNRR
jgi:hypothetical protein